MIGDLAGFCAAIAAARRTPGANSRRRLLAQVDSQRRRQDRDQFAASARISSAPSTSPRWCLADTGALDTLSAREFRAGYAEVVKYGLIDDREFFEWLEAHWRDVFAGGPARQHAIAASCAAKARVVASDETEQGERALLNLGHTFGHAFERADPLRRRAPRAWRGRRRRHGLRVPLLRATRPLHGQDAVRVENHLRARRPADADFAKSPASTPIRRRSWRRCARTRRSSAAELTFILATGIGESFIAKRRRRSAGARLSQRRTGAEIIDLARSPAGYGRLLNIEGSMSLTVDALIVLASVFASAFFRGAETALTAASRARMHALEMDGDQRRQTGQPADRDARAPDQRDAARRPGRQHRRVGFRDQRARRGRRRPRRVYATAIMTALIVVFAEVLPKTIAIAYPDRVSLVIAPIVSFFVTIFWPVVAAIESFVRSLSGFAACALGERRTLASGTRGTARRRRPPAPRRRRRAFGARHVRRVARTRRDRGRRR